MKSPSGDLGVKRELQPTANLLLNSPSYFNLYILLLTSIFAIHYSLFNWKSPLGDIGAERDTIVKNPTPHSHHTAQSPMVSQSDLLQ